MADSTMPMKANGQPDSSGTEPTRPPAGKSPAGKPESQTQPAPAGNPGRPATPGRKPLFRH